MSDHLHSGFGFLVTHGGTHTAEAWAEATASGLVSIDPGMASDRLLAAAKLRATVVGILVAAFRRVHSGTSATEASAVSDECLAAMAEPFGASPWASSFEHPDIRREIGAYITRNLLTAADLALKAE